MMKNMLKKFLQSVIILSSSAIMFSCEEAVKVNGYPDSHYPMFDVVINSTDLDITVEFTDYERNEVKQKAEYDVSARSAESFNIEENRNFCIKNSDKLKISFSDGNEIIFKRNDKNELNPYKGLKGVLIEEEDYVKYEIVISEDIYKLSQISDE